MKRWLVVECALLVAMIAIVRWLGDHATPASLHDGRRPTWDVVVEPVA